jgi:8-oxo-dGTP pyrophosphatase MutT (NUDIX family)
MAADAEQAVVPRPAATAIVLRACDDGLETFMVRRDPRSRFAADAYVFPGGTLQPDDYLSDDLDRRLGLTETEAHQRFVERGGDAPSEPAMSLALHVAAARELFEEAGVLLVGQDSRVLQVGSDDAVLSALEHDRADLQEGRAAFIPRMFEHDITIAIPDLVYFSHWITPAPSPRRYDTRFFICELPPGQVASHCGVETIDGAWITPARALERFESGEISLVSVTLEHLKRLAQFTTPAAALEYARAKPIRTVNPVRRGGDWENGRDNW